MKKLFKDWIKNKKHIIFFYDYNLEKENIIHLLNKIGTNDFTILDRPIKLDRHKKYIYLFKLDYTIDTIKLLKLVNNLTEWIPIYLSISENNYPNVIVCDNHIDNFSESVISNYPKKQVVVSNKFPMSKDINEFFDIKRINNGVDILKSKSSEEIIFLNKKPIIKIQADVLHLTDSNLENDILEKIQARNILVYTKIDPKLGGFIENMIKIHNKIKMYKKYSYKLILDQEYYILE